MVERRKSSIVRKLFSLALRKEVNRHQIQVHLHSHISHSDTPIYIQTYKKTHIHINTEKIDVFFSPNYQSGPEHYKD